ncbi:hypothetical protein Tco_0344979, partial [Tanacetum coccineum]
HRNKRSLQECLLFQERGGDMCKQEEAVGAITALSAEFISALVLEEKKRRPCLIGIRTG